MGSLACDDSSGSKVGGTGGTGGGSQTGTGGSAGQVDWDETAPEAAAMSLAMGHGFNLGQVFESTQHPRDLATAQAKIKAYYELGFRHMRLPVTWTEAVGGDTLVTDPAVGKLNRTHERLTTILAVIDFALSLQDFYVVLDAHHETTLKEEGRSEVLAQLWGDIADLLRDRSHHLAFELLNEPHLSDSSAMAPAQVREMSQRAYQAIRAIDPQRVVVIGGNQWFAASELANTWPDLSAVGGGKDSYLMATFHHYSPWTFCGDHQGDYADAWTAEDQEAPFRTAQAWADKLGVPYYVGEWGVGYRSVLSTMDCNNIRAWYQSFDAETAKKHRAPTTVWDDGGWFGIWNYESKEWDNNLADCINASCSWNGQEQRNSACL